MAITMKVVIVEWPDKSEWYVPVSVIARSRAAYYAHEYDGDIEKSLDEDTLPLFARDDYEIVDWARNNMDWKDVERIARPAFVRRIKVSEAAKQEAWVNGPMSVTEIEADEKAEENG